MHNFAETIPAAFSELPQVQAVMLGGSRTAPAGETLQDKSSDYDLYVYVSDAIPTETRLKIAARFADHIEIDNQFWEPGDEWLLRKDNTGVDIMYRWWDWIHDQIERVVDHHQASVGYSTCFWYNILHSSILYDPDGTASALHQRCRVPYPEQLVRNIINKNYPILRNNISSYRAQIAKACSRDDLISLNHRTAAFVASYVDILLAVNRRLHPGEKKLLAVLLNLDTPHNADRDLRNLLKHAGTTTGSPAPVLADIDRLVDELDSWLQQHV